MPSREMFLESWITKKNRHDGIPMGRCASCFCVPRLCDPCELAILADLTHGRNGRGALSCQDKHLHRRVVRYSQTPTVI